MPLEFDAVPPGTEKIWFARRPAVWGGVEQPQASQTGDRLVQVSRQPLPRSGFVQCASSTAVGPQVMGFRGQRLARIASR
jgi:hypothetical protein